MFKLSYGIILSVIVTGYLLFTQFLWSLPDGKLHLTVCNVGQGDASYVRFPDGRDMLVDAGPGKAVLKCLGERMPFWDRKIDIVVFTHPQKDHVGGLTEVLRRYRVQLLLSNGIPSQAPEYREIISLVKSRHVESRYVDRGDTIPVSGVQLNVVWPTADLAASMGRSDSVQSSKVAGVTSDRDPNDGSVVLHLKYGEFDAFLSGDADSRVEAGFRESGWGSDPVEILKVAHHGSAAALTTKLLERLRPNLAIISVGKNSYGHPAPELLDLLSQKGIQVVRTDQEGNVTIVSDGRGWKRE